VYLGIGSLGGSDWLPPESGGDDSTEDKELEDAFRFSPQEYEKRAKSTHGHFSHETSNCSEHSRLLAKVYLQADRLQDFATANLIIDEFIDFGERTNISYPNSVTNMVYESTVHGSPFRKLMRDAELHEIWSGYHLDPHSIKFHEDYTRDIFVEFLRVRNAGRRKFLGVVYGRLIERIREADSCVYHLHGDHHPSTICVPDPELLEEDESE